MLYLVTTVNRLIFGGDLSWLILLGPKNRQIKQPPVHIALIQLIENITKLSQLKQQSVCPEGKIRQIKQPPILIGLQQLCDMLFKFAPSCIKLNKTNCKHNLDSSLVFLILIESKLQCFTQRIGFDNRRQCEEDGYSLSCQKQTVLA